MHTLQRIYIGWCLEKGKIAELEKYLEDNNLDIEEYYTYAEELHF